MKKLLALILLLLPLSASATTTVTGHISDLSGTSSTRGTFARFYLRGCAGNQPRVNGVALIAPTQGAVFFKDLVADSSGNVSGTLYSTRDSTGLLAGEISCGGSQLSEWYGLVIFVAGKGGPETPIHALNGVGLDITSVIPIVSTPPPPSAGSSGTIAIANTQVAVGAGSNNITGSNALTYDPVAKILALAAAPATAGNNLSSPTIKLNSDYWNGSASVLDTWTIAAIIGTGTNPSTTFSVSNPRNTVVGSSIVLPVGAVAIGQAGSGVNGSLAFIGTTSGSPGLEAPSVSTMGTLQFPTANPTLPNQCWNASPGGPLSSAFTTCSLLGGVDDQTALVATRGLAFFSVGTTNGNHFRLCYAEEVTTSDASGKTITFSTTFTSRGISRTVSGSAVAVSSTANSERSCIPMFVDSSTTVNYTVTASGAFSTAQYAIDVWIYRE